MINHDIIKIFYQAKFEEKKDQIKIFKLSSSHQNYSWIYPDSLNKPDGHLMQRCNTFGFVRAIELFYFQLGSWLNI